MTTSYHAQWFDDRFGLWRDFAAVSNESGLTPEEILANIKDREADYESVFSDARMRLVKRTVTEEILAP